MTGRALLVLTLTLLACGGEPAASRPPVDPFAGGVGFAPLPRPEALDWLASHKESGQTYQQYLHGPHKLPTKERSIIYLQPLAPPPPPETLEHLRRYTEAFFALETRVLPLLELDDHDLNVRERAGLRQAQTTKILPRLAKIVPPNGYCLLAVTMIDLYPDPSWNYVFGQATLAERVGIYSLARFDPPAAFAGEEFQQRGLERACKVLTHEAGHMFGIRHCTAWACVMNGSNHLAELDRQPLHACPVDLQKLQHAISFDVANRYERLAVVTDELGFHDAAKWNRARARSLTMGAGQSGSGLEPVR